MERKIIITRRTKKRINRYNLQASTCLFDWIKGKTEKNKKSQPQDMYFEWRDVSGEVYGWSKETLKRPTFSLFDVSRADQRSIWLFYRLQRRTRQNEENSLEIASIIRDQITNWQTWVFFGKHVRDYCNRQGKFAWSQELKTFLRKFMIN